MRQAGKDLSPAGFPGQGNGIFKSVISPEQLTVNNKGKTAAVRHPPCKTNRLMLYSGFSYNHQ
ncbi:uncharacterized protein METZ01_LOCUS154527 [marine metagenome]|uniref:Uncharacterized protein n=1 Tax=marine metagenome TaxID=408172 RepID=A0A382AKY0_9ZZZZ